MVRVFMRGPNFAPEHPKMEGEMNRRHLTIVALGLLMSTCFLSGCAQEKLEIKNPFPSRQELVQLSAQNVSAEAVEAPEVSVVDTWKLHGPLPEQIGFRPHTPKDAVEEAFYGGIGSDPGELTGSTAMHCAAREIGYFVLEHEKLPYQSLSSFIYARCGVLATGTSVRFRTRSGATDQDGVGIASAAAQSVAKGAAAATHQMDGGFWHGKKGDRVAFVTTYGRVLVDIKPTPMRAEAGEEVVLEGRVLMPKKEEIFALINRGDFGFRRCKQDPSVKMPAFRVTCPVATEDEFAYFQLMASTKTSIMASTVLQQLVWPGGELSDVYRSPATRRALAKAKLVATQKAAEERAAQASADNQASGEQASGEQASGEQASGEQASGEQASGETAEQRQVEPIPLAEATVSDSAVSDSAGYPTRFISLLNQVRREANMGPIEHAERQSAVIQSMTEQFFAAGFGQDEQVANKLAMGILAGWDVGGAIIDADLASDWSTADQPAQLLETMLESPKGRQTLMDPASSEISLGSLEREHGIGVVVASYSFVPDEHPNRRVKRVIDALSEQRQAFGSRAAKEDPKLRARARKLSKHIEAGNLGILEARDKLLEAAAERYRKPVFGYAFVGHSLDNFNFPNDMLTSKNLPVAVVVAPYTKQGHPWTMYAVILVFPKQPKANLASLDGLGESTSAKTSATIRSR
jgi:hypothetical protein